MSKTKTTVLVYDHRNRTKDGGQGPVEVRVTVGRQSWYIQTGIRVHRQEFVAGFIVDCPGADKLNERLRIIYEKVCAAVNDCIEQGTSVSVDEIRRRVWHEVERQSGEDTLLKWIGDQISLLPISEGTRKHYYPLQDRLAEWGVMSRWEDVTAENVSRFDAWLRTLRKPVGPLTAKAGIVPPLLSDAGVYNYHKCLKALLNRAYAFGKIDRNPYDRLKGQFKRGERENPEYLTEDEVERIRTLRLPLGGVLDVARDLFVFQTFTGLSYCDAMAFDFSQYKNIGGRWRLTGQRIKTGVPYVSQLLPPALAVLEKYGGQVPHVGNADYNHRLKEIGALCGIATRMHSHLGRHTFATMMLRGGAKIENVSKMLGHTNIQQTLRYGKVLAQSVHEDFEMLEGRWK